MGAFASDPSSGLSIGNARAGADRTLDALPSAAASGYRNLALMRADPDLAPINSRTDFIIVLRDPEFPADVFARPR